MWMKNPFSPYIKVGNVKYFTSFIFGIDFHSFEMPVDKDILLAYIIPCTNLFSKY